MKKLTLTAGLILLAGPALAHTGHGDANGFVHGLQHPIFGPDHLLAMLAVGLWSGFAVPERFWLGAVTFLSAMAAGAGLAWAGVAIPNVEGLILASVLVFGLLVLVAKPGQSKLMTTGSLVAIAAFAACHGHAHASEATGGVLAYLAGFLISTAALHLVGIAVARRVAQSRASNVAQAVLGGAIAASGLYLMVG